MDIHPDPMVADGHLPAPQVVYEAALPQAHQQAHQEPLPEPHQDLHQESHQQPHQEVPYEVQEAQSPINHTVEGDESMNTTITESTIAPLPEMQPGMRNNSYANEHPRPQTSYSDNTFSHGYSHGNQEGGYGSRFNTPSDADTPPRHSFYNSGKETQIGQPHSRPNSMMGHRPASEGNTRSAAYLEQNQRTSQTQQEPANKSTSVVIKVGMVGDAQIGKTSLMVKYVEGSWDEDYIQTLGGLKLSIATTTSY